VAPGTGLVVLPQSLKRDAEAVKRCSTHRQTARLANVDDVTQDQPNPRALRAIAVSAFPSAAFHIATTTLAVSSRRFAAARRIHASEETPSRGK